MIVNKQLALSDFKETDLWETPDHIFAALNKMFHFTLDPCATKENAKCKWFFTEMEDGLKQSWNGAIVFCNPPYSRGNIDKWVKKCFNNRKGQTIVALVPVSTSSDWFQKYCIGQTLYFIDKRVRFKGAKYTAPFSSMIVHFNDKNEVRSFKQEINLFNSEPNVHESDDIRKVKDAIEWYGEKAASAVTYIDNGQKAHILHAIIVELSLDGGKRAGEAITTLSEQIEQKDKEIKMLKSAIKRGNDLNFSLVFDEELSEKQKMQQEIENLKLVIEDRNIFINDLTERLKQTSGYGTNF